MAQQGSAAKNSKRRNTASFLLFSLLVKRGYSALFNDAKSKHSLEYFHFDPRMESRGPNL